MSGRTPTKRQKPERQRSESLGRSAEDAVARQWLSQGYEVLAQRLRTPAGEIDLVVADAETLVFLEVKARKSFGEAAYAVLPRQQSRLLNAAETVLATHEAWHRPAIRFDVALVSGADVQHIPDAIRYA